MRNTSKVANGWWDYTTLPEDLLSDAARLTARHLQQLTRPGFEVVIYDSLDEFYLAEALEYIRCWRQATSDNPFGMRLTALMISKRIADSSVPMSLLAQHDRVKFSFYRRAIGTCGAEMH